MKKLSRVSILIILLILINSVAISASSNNKGQWKQNNTGWWYQNSDKTYPNSQWSQINSKWYYFNSRGYMETGWIKVGGSWYYLNNDGSMATGWKKLGSTWYYLNSSGRMTTNWAKVGQSWYYMDSSGSMASKTWISGTYYVGANGAMLTDTITPDGYLVDKNGKYINMKDSLPNHGLHDTRGEMIDLVNQERIEAGVRPLEWDKELGRVAKIKALDIAENNYYGHNSPNLGSPFDLMKVEGIKYSKAAENLVWAKNLSPAHYGLMNSPGHKANILRDDFTHIGIGISEHATYGNVYVQMFIKK